MGRPAPATHTYDELLAYADTAEQAMVMLRSAGEHLKELPGQPAIHIEQSGTIARAMKSLIKFAGDAFLAAQKQRIVTAKNSDTPHRDTKTYDEQRQPKSDTLKKNVKTKDLARIDVSAHSSVG